MEAPDDTRHAIARDRRDFYADRRRTGEYLRHAATKSGRRPMSLVGEFLQLRRGRGRLTFPEYVQYGVYDTARIGHEEQSRFIANNLHWPMTRTCCDMTFQAVTEDKWLCSKTLSGSDVPVPETLAVIDRGERSYPGTRKISTVDELREFSLSPGSLPFFAKENRGICSWGAMLALEADQDRIHIRNEGWIDYRTLLDECMGETPYLLQRVERNHEFLDRYADALATVRLCILLSDDGFKVPFAVLKLPSGKHVADNFWRPGNLACAVDPETGTVLTVRTKNALGTTDYREHPGTGEALAEERLPMWDRVLAIAERASWVFEPVRYQSMDIAIGDDGPVLVEANTGGVRLAATRERQGFPHRRGHRVLSRKRIFETLARTRTENTSACTRYPMPPSPFRRRPPPKSSRCSKAATCSDIRRMGTRPSPVWKRHSRSSWARRSRSR